MIRRDTEAPLKYVAGDPSVDLVNTVDWTSAGPTNERLTSYERLVRWAEGAGLVSNAEARGLRRGAAGSPDRAEATLEEALRLRDLLQRLYRSIAESKEDPAAWEELNRELAAALPRLRLQPRSPRRKAGPLAHWVWGGAVTDPESILPRVFWAASELLRSPDVHRLEICDGPDCGWMYVDRSRNGLRRWCEMETCGTEAKTRRRRERRRAG